MNNIIDYFIPYWRIGRQKFWIFFIIFSVISLSLFWLLLSKTSFLQIYLLFILWQLFVIFSRRLTDLNKSPFYLLLIFIPLINLLFIIYLIILCGFIKGSKWQNQYGPDPLKHNRKKRDKKLSKHKI